MCIIGRNTENKSELNRVKEIVNDFHENISYTYTNLDTSQMLLSTAKILIRNCNNKWITCNAVLDSASQSHFNERKTI